jgi:hypothetical protein
MSVILSILRMMLVLLVLRVVDMAGPELAYRLTFRRIAPLDFLSRFNRVAVGALLASWTRIAGRARLADRLSCNLVEVAVDVGGTWARIAVVLGALCRIAIVALLAALALSSLSMILALYAAASAVALAR